MNSLKTSWCLWAGWNPEKVEKWLESMALNGWIPYTVDMLGVRFKFKKSKSRKVRYCVDFQQNIEDQYIKLLEDDGWELLWNDAWGWYIWKKAYVKERPSLYTDSTSLIERNNRVLKVLQPLFIMILGVFALMVVFNDYLGSFKHLLWSYLVIIAFYSYIFLQTKKFNDKLKENRIGE